MARRHDRTHEDYADYLAYRRQRGSRGHGARQGMKFSTMVMIAIGVWVWIHSQVDDTTTDHPAPHPVSTVCNQYFKGGC